MVYFSCLVNLIPLVQLERAFDYESKGRGFESLMGCHLYSSLVKSVSRLTVNQVFTVRVREEEPLKYRAYTTRQALEQA